MPRIDVPFVVEKQRITQPAQVELVAGGQNYFYATFNLCKTWRKISGIKALFTRDNISKLMDLTEGNDCMECQIPWEVMNDIGVFHVGIFGGDRLLTNMTYVVVKRGCLTEGEPPAPPSEDWFRRIEREISELDSSKADKEDCVGSKLPTTGSEIFNDYEKNSTNIPYGHIEGRNNTANVKTFLIESCSYGEKEDSITLKPSDGNIVKISAGMNWNIFTLEGGMTCKYNGVISRVLGNTAYIAKNKLPSTLIPSKRGSFYNTFIVNGGSVGDTEITDCSGDFSVHIEGTNNKAVLDSHAEGTGTKAIGYSSHAEGRKTTASGECSHAEGYEGIASGDCSHVEGAAEKASGHYSHAEGYKTKATGTGSHAEGNITEASAKYAHAEGSDTHATGVYSHAEGECSVANGYAAHAEGYNGQALKMTSHAEGYMCISNADYSHAEGYKSEAHGAASHVEGYRNWAMSDNQHVQGRYNISDNKGVYAHIVGNGTSDADRKNAHTLDWSGNAWYAGSVEATAIILKSPNGTRYKITVNDNGVLSTAKV